MKSLLNWRKAAPIHHQPNPFSLIQDALDRTVDELCHPFSSTVFSKEDWESLILSPSIDIVEDKDSYKIEAEMPGMGLEDIDVSVSDGLLTISGEKTTSKKDQNTNHISREIRYGSYKRNIALPDYLNVNQAKASFKKGMLWVTIPKKEEVRKNARNIKIEQSED